MAQGVFWDAQPAALHAEIAAALRAPQIALAVLAGFDFSTGPVRLCTWTVPVLDGRDGHEWQPFAGQGGFQDVEGGPATWAPLRIYHLTVPLHILQSRGGVQGPFPDLRDKAVYHRRPVTLSLQILRPGAGAAGRAAPLGHPMVLHTGLMDRLEVKATREGIRHELHVEGVLTRKGVQGAALLTPRDQKRRHPGDLGLDYVLEVESRPAIWPDY